MPVGFTAGTYAAAAVVAGAAITAYGAIQQGQQANAQAQYQATIMQQQADRERAVAAVNEEAYRKQQSRLMASRRAILGGSGVEGGTGSPLMVSEDMASQSELQALTIRNGGEASSTRLNEQAALSRYQGETAESGGYFRAGASLLSGAGNAYSVGSGRSGSSDYSTQGKFF